MSASLLSGLPIAGKILDEVKNEAAILRTAGIVPGLGTIFVGDDPASAGYVHKKLEACRDAGIESFHIQIPSTVSQRDLLDAVNEFNNNGSVDAYLVQNPVPGFIQAGMVKPAPWL